MSSKSGFLAKKCKTTSINHHLSGNSSPPIKQLYRLIDKNNDKNKSAPNQLYCPSTHSTIINNSYNSDSNSTMVRTESDYSPFELSTTKTYERTNNDDSIVLSTESSLGGTECESNEKVPTMEPLLVQMENNLAEYPMRYDHKTASLGSHKGPDRQNKAPRTTNIELSNRRLLRILHEGANGNLLDIRHFSKGPNGYNMYGDGIRLSLDEWNTLMGNRRHITQQLKTSNCMNKRINK